MKRPPEPLPHLTLTPHPKQSDTAKVTSMLKKPCFHEVALLLIVQRPYSVIMVAAVPLVTTVPLGTGILVAVLSALYVTLLRYLDVLPLASVYAVILPGSYGNLSAHRHFETAVSRLAFALEFEPTDPLSKPPSVCPTGELYVFFFLVVRFMQEYELFHP
jgi:hypothetical protein